ncbi:MAG: NYN domain-containing protein [Candidatus Blackburnbacteria bacterium]|nr:NYN domain-containing protein [Candidatus Blackburnbacteria bacterium]
MEKSVFKLRLQGKTAVFIDWANVYGWTNRLNKEVDPRKLYRYLKSYKDIDDLYFYYGLDKHPKSKQFLRKVKQIGFDVVTKEVKYIPVSIDASHFKHITREIKESLNIIKHLETEDIEKILQILNRKVLRRKCDFDIEIALDCFENLGKYKSFVFFSGDGDFATLYKRLIKAKKQVVVVYAPGHIGREIWEIQRGLFKVNIQNMGL